VEEETLYQSVGFLIFNMVDNQPKYQVLFSSPFTLDVQPAYFTYVPEVLRNTCRAPGQPRHFIVHRREERMWGTLIVSQHPTTLNRRAQPGAGDSVPVTETRNR
jgi:hypothetical protein